MSRPGGGDEDVSTLAREGVFPWGPMETPPTMTAAGEWGVCAEVVEVFEDLGGEFAGGGDDEDAGHSGGEGMGEEFVHGGEEEGGGFTGASLGASEHIFAEECGGMGSGLDGSGAGEG